MSYRLQPHETLPTGIRRIAREQTEGALGELRALAPEKPAAAIHGTRKHLKKIRALLRLVCEQIGPEIFAEENQRLRDVGRALSSARDAEVQFRVLEKVRTQAQQPKSAFRKTATLLKSEIAAATDLAAEREAALTTLQWITDRIEGWPLDDLKADDVCCALQRFYRRAREGFRAAAKDPTAKRLHDWRKRVKDVWYQSRLLQNLQPVVMCGLAAEAKELGRNLGDLHDLQFFRARLESDGQFTVPERLVLVSLLGTEERTLQETALDLGARFFAEKPRALEKRLLRYAQSWRPASGLA